MTRRRRAVAPLLILLASVPLSSGASQQGDATGKPPDRGTLAVLRRDGLSIPFASVVRDIWHVWPANLRNLEIPVTLDAIPDRWWGGRPPETWQAWPAGSAPQPVSVSAPTTVRIYCDGRLAFRTSYRSGEALPPAAMQPYPKDGLVVGGGLRLEPIEIVDRGSTERGALAVALLSAFNRAEDSTVDTVRSYSRWRHPVGEDERHASPVRIESWYRAALDEPGWGLSFIEAVRAYPPRPEDEGCGLETLFSGWVFSSPDDPIERTDLIAKITYCDRVGAVYMLPFGRLRVRNDLYWVFQMSGWDEEWYTVARVRRNRVNYPVEYLAGTRRSCER